MTFLTSHQLPYALCCILRKTFEIEAPQKKLTGLEQMTPRDSLHNSLGFVAAEAESSEHLLEMQTARRQRVHS